MGAVLNEVVGPDVVRPAWAETDTRTVVEPQPAALRLFAGNLEPLAPPDAPHSLDVDWPAIGPQQCGDPTVAITAIRGCKANGGLGQGILIVPQDRPVPLGRTMLTQNLARPSLGDLKNTPDMAHRGPAPCGAQ